MSAAGSQARRPDRPDGAGPQGVYTKIPGLGPANMADTRILPLGQGELVERDGTVFVRRQTR